MFRLFWVGLAFWVPPFAFSFESPRFVAESLPVHRYEGGWEFFVGGGVAAFDCNGDRFPELFLAGGTRKASLFVNRSERGGKIVFEDAVASPLRMGGVLGAYPLDFDNDGIVDLFVLKLGANQLWKGLGGCRFADVSREAGFFRDEAWSTAFSAVWEAGNDLPTLAVGNYVNRNAPGSPFGTCHDNLVYRPAGKSGKYRPPLRMKGYCALSMLFSDWNRDKIPDLRISNDRQYYVGGKEQLFRFNPGLKPYEYGSRDGWRTLKIWGMGIASHDLNDTGYPDYFLTSMADNKLRTLLPQSAFGELKPAYEEKAGAYGVTAHRPYLEEAVYPSTAWHAEFEDFNNDGFMDLFIAKGNVDSMPDFAERDPNNLLINVANRRFVEKGGESGVMNFRLSRGASAADLNLDGLPDLTVVNRKAEAEVYRNTGAFAAATESGSESLGRKGDDGREKTRPMGSWLNVRLRQDRFNRYAAGAWVEVKMGARIIRRENVIGGGHAGGKLTFLHFGTGTAEFLTVRVLWPSGDWSHWYKVLANQFVVIDKDRPRPIYLHPRKRAVPCGKLCSAVGTSDGK